MRVLHIVSRARLIALFGADRPPRRWDCSNHLPELLRLGFQHLPPSSPTSARLPGRYPGEFYFDTTLGVPVWWNGGRWGRRVR